MFVDKSNSYCTCIVRGIHTDQKIENSFLVKEISNSNTGLPYNSENDLVKTSGLLIGRGKKSQIFRDKFAEKMADFAEISREFSRPVSPKNDW